MTDTAEMVPVLHAHLELCRQLGQVLESENQALRNADAESAFDGSRQRKSLLPELDRSLQQLKRIRAAWLRLTPAERQDWPQVATLLRHNQDQIMKVIVLDRENEQLLLRRGLLPANQLPAANRQRPHYVADLYRRHGQH